MEKSDVYVALMEELGAIYSIQVSSVIITYLEMLTANWVQQDMHSNSHIAIELFLE